LNFLEEKGITIRQKGENIQLNAAEICAALNFYKPRDAYCLLGVTNTDIYPRPEWDFVFGYANIGARTGVFSFARYDPTDACPEPAHTWFTQSTYVMVHEIAHMFGLSHCPYYECVMNGIMSADEGRRRKQGGSLCAICLRKLQLNVQFDVADRYENLLKVCEKLGFAEELTVYKDLLTRSKQDF